MKCTKEICYCLTVFYLVAMVFAVNRCLLWTTGILITWVAYNEYSKVSRNLIESIKIFSERGVRAFKCNVLLFSGALNDTVIERNAWPRIRNLRVRCELTRIINTSITATRVHFARYREPKPFRRFLAIFPVIYTTYRALVKYYRQIY